jgi:hypothetical protein
MGDSFKRQIKGYRGSGKQCPCCREGDKRTEARLARARVKVETRRHLDSILIQPRGWGDPGTP